MLAFSRGQGKMEVCGFEYVEDVWDMTYKCICRDAFFDCLLLITTAAVAWSQIPQTQPVITPSVFIHNRDAKENANGCRVYQVTDLPGSHRFPSEFIEAIATDPSTKDSNVLWGLTADINTQIPASERAMYISKSIDYGATWIQVARIDARYFDAEIGEGLRNGFIVSPGANYFVITTQRGAFQVFPRKTSEPVVKPLMGPRVPSEPFKVPITKKAGDPVRANVVGMTVNEEHLIVGYGYFDRDPQLITYRKGIDGTWVEDGRLPRLPTDMDLLSMQFDNPENPEPGYLYVGTGDQAYLLNLRSKQWSRIQGVGPDSAIHGMSVVGGLHLAACWGIYNPSGPGSVRRVTDAKFVLHRSSDESGSNLRTYSIEVDPLRKNREIITSITGVYTSQDGGERWRRFNDLPEGEFRLAHFNPDGSVLVSGMPGTFLIDPFSETCIPQLKTRRK